MDRVGWAYPHITTYATVHSLVHHLACLVTTAKHEQPNRVTLLTECATRLRLVEGLGKTVGRPSRAFNLLRLSSLPSGF